MTNQVHVIIQQDDMSGLNGADPSNQINLIRPDANDGGLSDADVLTREAFQNIFDLSSDPSSDVFDVKAIVESKFLGEANWEQLKSLIAEDELQKLVSYSEMLTHENATSGFGKLNDGASVPCLIFSDHVADTSLEAKGMHGSVDPTYYNLDPNHISIFYKYCVKTGYTDKKRDSKRVGGHGVGKVAMALGSYDQFYALYTYTNEINDEGGIGVHKFIGLGIADHQEMDDLTAEDYKLFGQTTGFHYIASHHSKTGSNAPREIRGNDAIKLAKAFGINERSGEDYGTSMCILNPTATVQDIKDSYEKYFFPAHFEVKQEPDVTFIDHVDGKKQFSKPSFDLNSGDLSKFIRCYKIAKSGNYDEQDSEAYVKFRASQKLPSIKESPGAMGFCTFEDEGFDENGIRNKTALIRGFMVINYTSFQGRIEPLKNFASAYLIPRESEQFKLALACSEPAKHHVFDPKPTKRLTNHQSTLVQVVLKRITDTVREYISKLSPSEQYNTRQAKELAKMLGKIFSVSLGGDRPEPPEKKPSEVDIDIDQLSVERNGKYQIFTFLVSCRLNDNFDPSKHSESIKMIVSPRVLPALAKSQEPVPLRWRDKGGKFALNLKGEYDLKNKHDSVCLEFQAMTVAEDVLVDVSANIQDTLEETNA